MLDVVPGRPDAEDGPARADDVEGGDDLGQVRRVAVGHPGHHGAEPDPSRSAPPGRRAACRSRASAGWARPAVAIGRSGPSPTPSRSPCPRPRSPWRRPRRRGRRVSSPAVKLGICSPKRMRPEPTGRRSARPVSPPGAPAQPGQGDLPLGGLEGSNGRQPGRGRPERALHEEATDRGKEDGDHVGVDRHRGNMARQQLLGRGAAFEHHRGRPRDHVEDGVDPTAAWGQSTNTTPSAARSTLSARTSPCTSVEPSHASGQPDSSSANRSRCARAHSSRPAGGAPWRPARAHPPNMWRRYSASGGQGRQRARGEVAVQRRQRVGDRGQLVACHPGMPRRAPVDRVEGERHPVPVVIGVQEARERAASGAAPPTPPPRAGAGPASRG